MTKNHWNKGYKEVKNAIHNEMGMTKEELREVFSQIAKDEIKQIVSESRPFIRDTIKEVIQDEMVRAVKDHRYPDIKGNRWMYGRKGDEASFQDFISGIIKEEVVTELRNQFDFSVNVGMKSPEQEKNSE